MTTFALVGAGPARALRGTTGPSRIVAHHTTDTEHPRTADATATSAR
ncbi:hypothetical protein ACGF1Z_33610 [Streptomyces sp. NPDC048018]